MKDSIDETLKTYSDPNTHKREIEKGKLNFSNNDSEQGRSLIEAFTGDHKLKNFTEKLKTTERKKLKLSDYLMASVRATETKKSVL